MRLGIDHGNLVDLDAPCSDDPDDGFAGVGVPEINKELAGLGSKCLRWDALFTEGRLAQWSFGKTAGGNYTFCAYPDGVYRYSTPEALADALIVKGAK